MTVFKMIAIFCTLLWATFFVAAQNISYTNASVFEMGPVAPFLVAPHIAALPTASPELALLQHWFVPVHNATDIPLHLMHNVSAQCEIKVAQAELVSPSASASAAFKNVVHTIGSKMLDVAALPIPLLINKASALGDIISRNADLLQSRLIPLMTENSSLKAQISHKSAFIVSQSQQIEKLKTLVATRDAQLEIEARKLVQAKDDAYKTWVGQAQLAAFKMEDWYWMWWLRTVLALVGVVAIGLACNWSMEDSRCSAFMYRMYASRSMDNVRSIISQLKQEVCDLQNQLSVQQSASSTREFALQATVRTLSATKAQMAFEIEQLNNKISADGQSTERLATTDRKATSELRAINQQQRKTIDDLQREIKQLKQTTSYATASVSQARMTQLDCRIQTLTTQNNQLEVKNAQLEKIVRSAQEARTEAAEQIQSLHESAACLTSTHAAELETQKAVVCTLEEQVQSLASELVQAKETITQLNRSVPAVAPVAPRTPSAASLAHASATSSKIIKFMEAQRNKSVEIGQHLVGAVECIVSHACGLEAQVSLEEAASALIAFDEHLSAEISRMQKMDTLVILKKSPPFLACRESALESIRQSQAIVNKLQQLFQPMQAARADSEAKYTAVESARRSLETELANTRQSLKTELANTRQSLKTELANTRQSLKTELADTRRAATRRVQLLEEQVSAEKSQSAAIPGLHSRIARLVKEKSDLLSEGTALQEQYTTYRQAAQQTLQKTQGQLATSQQQSTELQQQVAHCKHQQELQAEYDALYKGFVRVFAIAMLPKPNDTKRISMEPFQQLLSDFDRAVLRRLDTGAESKQVTRVKELKGLVVATRIRAENINAERRAPRIQNGRRTSKK